MILSLSCERLHAEFRGRRFEREDVRLLDFPGAEFILIGAGRNAEEVYGAKVTARREVDALPDIFRELQLRKERHPVRPLFEGIMAKRAESPYLSGARSTDWLKIKTIKRQEVVIIGFTAPRRSRQHFGSLVLAVRDDAAWRYVGHVGTGFSHTALAETHDKLWPLRTRSSPFGQRVKDEAVTTWVKPKLVAEVKFTEWTAAGEMRHPAFVGLRNDKKPEDVVVEKAVQPPS